MSQGTPMATGASESARLQDACGKRWTDATRHRFVRELADDTLPDSVFCSYLVQDHIFLDALVRLVAHTVSVAPGMVEERRLAGFLGILTSEENDYFERSFEALGVTPETRRQATRRDATRAFEALFAEAREEGSYATALGVLLPVEWVYLDWASWAARKGKESERFWLREWVALHAEEGFAAFVDWLRSELDAHAPSIDPDASQRLASRFRAAVTLEGAFFDDAYAATAK